MTTRFSLRKVRLNQGGYDSGGYYWGNDVQLWRAESQDDSDVTAYVRAHSRDGAKAQVRNDHPTAEFSR